MKYSFIILALFILISCHVNRQTVAVVEVENSDISETMAAPKIIIYKTNNDYSNMVPVGLSPDKKKIISFPAPTDVVRNNLPILPVKLPEGYYLDKMGIGTNVAYLRITIEDYSKLKTLPSAIQLFELIEDNNPLLEMWDCGIQTQAPDEISKITNWIITGKLANNALRLK